VAAAIAASVENPRRTDRPQSEAYERDSPDEHVSVLENRVVDRNRPARPAVIPMTVTPFTSPDDPDTPLPASYQRLSFLKNDVRSAKCSRRVATNSHLYPTSVAVAPGHAALPFA